MVERLAALLGGVDRDPQVVLDAVLADVLVEALRPQAHVEDGILLALPAGDDPIRCRHAASCPPVRLGKVYHARRGQPISLSH